jgi:hypothetical protein
MLRMIGIRPTTKKVIKQRKYRLRYFAPTSVNSEAGAKMLRLTGWLGLRCRIAVKQQYIPYIPSGNNTAIKSGITNSSMALSLIIALTKPSKSAATGNNQIPAVLGYISFGHLPSNCLPSCGCPILGDVDRQGEILHLQKGRMLRMALELS